MAATKTQPAPPITAGPAWKAAAAYGCDMELLESNLKKTPAERVSAHNRALNIAFNLREAMDKHHREALVMSNTINRF